MPPVTLRVCPHPLLDLEAMELRFPLLQGRLPPPPSLTSMLALDAEAPMRRSEDVRAAARALLRHAGFQPSGRSKPASEYLVRAAQEGALSSINLAADLVNVVSLHSGLPLSVVDLDKAGPPLRVEVGAEDAEFVFNASGQRIKVGRLLGLSDASGPCANAVKDAQRTKTDGGTTRALVLIWGSVAVPGCAGQVASWLRDLARGLGVQALPVDVQREA